MEEIVGTNTFDKRAFTDLKSMPPLFFKSFSFQEEESKRNKIQSLLSTGVHVFRAQLAK